MSRSLRPLPLAIGLTAVLGALALAKTVRPAYEARYQALIHAAEAERARLGLTEAVACQQDPTPEVRFEKALDVHPGQSVHLLVPGVFRAGIQGAVFEDDQVQLTSARAVKGGVEVEGKVSPDALPRPVGLSIATRLCANRAGFTALHIVARTRWDVRYPNGWNLKLTCDAGRGEGDSACEARWLGQGGPKVRQARLRFDGEGSYRVEIVPTQDELEAIQKRGMDALQHPPQEQLQRMQKAQAAFVACTKLAQAEMISCMQKVQPEMDQAAKAYQDAVQHQLGPDGPPGIGCTRALFQVEGKSVTANGEDCGTGGKRLEGGQGTLVLEG